jgi:DNA-3-methyladenine glycosylase II
MGTSKSSPARLEASAVDVAAVGLVTPDYWDEACKHLSKRDRVMRKLIADHGSARLESRGDAFTTLARSVVGQQISVKAAQSVWERLLGVVGASAEVAQSADVGDIVGHRGPLNPHALLAKAPEELRQAGLSARKVEYMRDLACHFAEHRVHVAQWHDMGDESIIEELVGIRGIGRWTAEMFLIFHLMRPNVLPLDDLGIIKGISLSYFSGEPVSRVEARDVAEAWSPFRTVGTWYLWRSLDPLPVAY